MIRPKWIREEQFSRKKSLGFSSILLLIWISCGEPALDTDTSNDESKTNTSDTDTGTDTDSATDAPCTTEVEQYCITRSQDQDGTVRFFYETRPSLQVALKFDLTKYSNYTTSHKLPLMMTLKADGKTEFFRLQVIDNTKPRTYSYTYDTRFGAYDAQHNHANYNLPFAANKSYRISQGYNGSFSHMGIFKYSLDFIMPVGEAIHAARGGIVIGAKQSSNEGGPTENFKDKANYVTILHNDGTIAEYLHLQQDGVSVSIGQQVAAGEAIGFSGNTGWSTAPHLHFHVLRMNREFSRETIATKFRLRDGSIAELKEGKTYTNPVAIGG